MGEAFKNKGMVDNANHYLEVRYDKEKKFLLVLATQAIIDLARIVSVQR